MFPLIDQIDHEILMHRNAHFAGQFTQMLDYYEKGKKGSQPDFEIDRIRELALLEREMGSDIAELVLLDVEKERVEESKKIYSLLKKSTKGLPKLISDLILTDEEYPEATIEALVLEKQKAVYPLIELLKTEHFHDPLFPGFALVPQLAAAALGQIGDKKAIISLFESITEGDFFDDEAAILALKSIGVSARDFLLKVVQSKPFTIDNDRAAMALVAFKDDPSVAKKCFEILKDPDFRKEEPFLAYLILACEGLKGTEEADEFVAFSSTLPKALKLDADAVIRSWKNISLK